jgi:5-formyltetrahydrofolate cyclo-ligase
MREKRQQLRAEAFHRRESISPSELGPRNERIQDRAVRFLASLPSRSVALYSPIGNEVATETIRDHALQTGKKLFYPKLGSEHRVRLVEVKSSEEMTLGRYGMLEPIGSRILAEQEREGLVVFVPGVVFDLHGNRLGRGMGWYDRLLRLLGEDGKSVALAYEFQVVEELPTEKWDRRVQHIITEERTIDCDARRHGPGGSAKSKIGRGCFHWNFLS